MGTLDEAVITVRSGDGGRGCISFRRKRHIPKGRPDGGDGGRGGNVIARATKDLITLSRYNSSTFFRAQDGQPGRGRNQSGKSGSDLILDFPLGTVLKDYYTGETLADLVTEADAVLVAPGGQGGKGNRHFAGPTRRSPRVAQEGMPGTQKKLKVCLKYIVDVVLIGLPNAGKSTLLSNLTKACPRIAEYPFTTHTPKLGIMEVDEGRPVVIAEIPGLIEGSSRGRGLGLSFLKHMERARLLLYLLDITYPFQVDILEDLHIVQEEIESYNPALLEKPQAALITKMDLTSPRHRDPGILTQFLKALGLKVLTVSCHTGMGLGDVRNYISSNLAHPESRIWEKGPEKACSNHSRE